MSKTTEVLLANLTEALRQVHRYVVVGLWAGISALALTPGSGMLTGEPETATPPGSPLPLDPATARVLLLGMCAIVGAMASYAAENANRIAIKLADDPPLLDAVRLSPGFPTSPYPLVRLGAAVLPAFFGSAAVLGGAFRSATADHFGVWMALALIASPYLVLAVELRHPVGMLEHGGAVASRA